MENNLVIVWRLLTRYWLLERRRIVVVLSRAGSMT